MRKVWAFTLGLFEHIRDSDMGRTWSDGEDCYDCNEWYDRGWNVADWLMRRT